MDRTDWVAVRKEFKKRWPLLPEPKEDLESKCEELEQMQLRDGDLGIKVTYQGQELYSHVAFVLCPITLAHNLLTNPVKNCTSVHSHSRSQVSEDPTRGLIPHPAPVPFGTSLASSNFQFHCSTIQVFSVPSSIVTPVSCPLHVPCSTCTTVFIPSDPMHVIHSAQTIKVPCVMYVPAI